MANIERKDILNMDKTYILPVPEEHQLLARKLSSQSGKIYSKAMSFLKKMNKKG